MANRTVSDAETVKGTNPQYLIEKIIRTRIYESQYWKEHCFALTAELMVDKAMELEFIGGVYGGNTKPSPFLCLALKMLQIQPDREIVIEFIRNEDFKYVRALGAFYWRMVSNSMECYKFLEPLYNDYRKLKMKLESGGDDWNSRSPSVGFKVIHMDEFIDTLLHDERVCDIILPRIQVSVLDEDLENMNSESSSESEEEAPPPPPPVRSRTRTSPKRRRSPSPRRRSPPVHRSRSRERRRRSRSTSRGREDTRDRHRGARERDPPRSGRHRSHSHSPRRGERASSPVRHRRDRPMSPRRHR